MGLKTACTCLLVIAARAIKASDAEEQLNRLYKDHTVTQAKNQVEKSKTANVAMLLRGLIESRLGAQKLDYKPSKPELKEFLKEEDHDVDKAFNRLKEKGTWKSKLGLVRMKDHIAPCLRSDGYSVCLEGLRARDGRVIVYSYGMPKGSVESVERQTAYLHDRVMISATTNYRESSEPYRALVVINCTSPSFRFPDKAIRKGGVEVVRKYYPWASSATTVFIGVPKPIQALFHLTKPIMGKLYDQFKVSVHASILLVSQGIHGYFVSISLRIHGKIFCST